MLLSSQTAQNDSKISDACGGQDINPCECDIKTKPRKRSPLWDSWNPNIPSTAPKNYTGRVITGNSRETDSKEVLKKLHWLPIRAQILYKILLLTYKALNNLAPQYLNDLLSIQSYVRNTRQSNTGIRLIELKSNLKFGGDRASSLRSSPNIYSFKKPYLFNECLM